MPHILSREKISLLLMAFEVGHSIRSAGRKAGVAKNTALRYWREWELGGTAAEIRERVQASYLAGRKSVTGGNYLCGRRGNVRREAV